MYVFAKENSELDVCTVKPFSASDDASGKYIRNKNKANGEKAEQV